MKRIISKILVAVMVMTMLTACSSSTAEESASATEDSKATETEATETEEATVEEQAEAVVEEVAEETGESMEGKFVGISMPSVGNDFLLALSQAIQGALEAQGCKVQIDSAENDVTTQISQIENFTTMGCDVIVVWAVNGDGVSSACTAAVNAGIPVMAFAYEIPGVTTTVVSASDAAMAEQCAAMASEWINNNYPDAGDGEVNVLVMTSSTVPESVTRSEGLKKIAENTKVNMITEEVENQDKTDAARTLTENTLLVHPEINVILTVNGTCAIGAESFVNSSASPIEDKSKFAIFCIDQTEEITAKIIDSVDNKSVLRGTISMGTFEDTIGDFMKGVTPLLTGQEPIERIDGKAFIVIPETLEVQ